MLRRMPVFLLLAGTAWCVMTFTHEAGHIVGGWSCGGTLVEAEIRPWRLPYSIFSPDPHPLVTLWCGPILGVIVPLIAAMLVRRDELWFVAGFCAFANGLYLAAASVTGDRYLDTAKLLEHGAAPINIFAYCALTIVWGYATIRRTYRSSFRPHRQPGP